MDKKEQKEEKNLKPEEIANRGGKVSLSAMKNVGKEVILAGQKYLVAPITLMDLDILDTNLILPIMGNKEVDDVYFAVNVTDPERAKIFYYIVEKYVKFGGDDKIPVTKELLNEHNWSIKDIKHFLEVWLQVSD